ncbi:MAG: DNA alkylation repair protein [Parcubacteria group bacterium]|nr:DNA alkylation repair protein [Parcubacteria group bacterium]
MYTLKQAERAMRALKNEEKIPIFQNFFKTGKGEYGEGDVFLGLAVPQTRSVAKEFSGLGFKDIKKLLHSKYHEERLCALLMLVHRFEKGSQNQQKEICDFYITQAKYVNNWDLVDLSADKIMGVYLLDRKKTILTTFAKSENLWERRISIIATYAFIKRGQFQETIRIAKILLQDKHDLIHKAVGWMLREVGKRELSVMEKFLQQHYKKMPRTMLRYAIEKLSEQKRQAYLKSKV